MADTVPKHNANIVHLTEILNDQVSGADNGAKAGTSGNIYTSTFREEMMAKGYAWVVGEVLRKAPEQAEGLLTGAIVSYTLAQVTAGIAVPLDYYAPLSLVRSTASTPPYNFIPPSKKGEADMDNLPDAKRVFTILGNTLYSYTRTNKVLTADNSISLLLYYYKRERINYTTGALIAANTADSRSADITLQHRWHEPAVYYTAFLCKSRNADEKNAKDAESFLVIANNLIQMEIGK